MGEIPTFGKAEFLAVTSRPLLVPLEVHCGTMFVFFNLVRLLDSSFNVLSDVSRKRHVSYIRPHRVCPKQGQCCGGFSSRPRRQMWLVLSVWVQWLLTSSAWLAVIAVVLWSRLKCLLLSWLSPRSMYWLFPFSSRARQKATRCTLTGSYPLPMSPSTVSCRTSPCISRE